MRARVLLAGLLAAGAAAGVSGCGRPLPTAAQLGGGSAGASAVNALAPTTDPATHVYTRPVVWATYREVQTLDPIQAFDYPEDTVDTALCDSLLRQNPDGSISSGIATATYPTPLRLVLDLRSGPRFWDGHPVTPADVVYDLKRAADPNGGGFYAATLERVRTIAATGPHQVTLTLKQPDYWLTGELSQMPGMVYEKAFAQRLGKKFGTPQGLTMCTGPFRVSRWIPGQGLTAVANPHYWDSTSLPQVKRIVFKGIGDDSSLTSGLETGAVQGTYPQALSTIDKLKADKSLTVSRGPSFAVDSMVLANLKGTLKDVRVRQAISLAIDRSAYVASVYHGDAQVGKALENPGAWGYGKAIFQRDWASLPDDATPQLARARALIKQAGAQGKSITIGTTGQINSLATQANLVRQAATEIGLKVTIRSVSAANFINFFTDAGARKGIDMFPTSNYSDYADPAGLYNTLAIPGGSQNYDGFSYPPITRLLARARAEANPNLRAEYVARAGDLILKQLPWIPMAAPDSVMITSRKLTGAPSSFVYMGGPWANLMGAR